MLKELMDQNLPPKALK